MVLIVIIMVNWLNNGYDGYIMVDNIGYDNSG